MHRNARQLISLVQTKIAQLGGGWLLTPELYTQPSFSKSAFPFVESRICLGNETGGEIVHLLLRNVRRLRKKCWTGRVDSEKCLTTVWPSPCEFLPPRSPWVQDSGWRLLCRIPWVWVSFVGPPADGLRIDRSFASAHLEGPRSAVRETIECLGKDLGNAKHPLLGVLKMNDPFLPVVRKRSVQNMLGAPRYPVARPKQHGRHEEMKVASMLEDHEGFGVMKMGQMRL